mmetsp:Transcript_5265/g.10280  ORF Transcript_5265/g.10280 Transcript_5265/m.10280 type:complete len:416 (+) Transcript_5265:151-1398(+)|eukprot:CAMPEP_0171331248 /NCGR_PEP_ID=MMETSP0878-20121228/2568_1 /TAXON_ID=67004 /ORGANISM="Thalassiosira weissflogii, Strain CCMP1336" /LENGTH=415 /DNA_ID=CAMNT_0011831747 /DNA_START=198 /DNA_END=1445 /DNA_ORIENTATION=+
MTTHKASKYLTLLLAASSDSPISAFAPFTSLVNSKSHASQPRPTKQRTSQLSPASSALTTPSTTALHVEKDNDRARMEKTFDDMMGDNWREFRARLIMQEHAQEMANNNSNGEGKNSSNEKDGKVGNFFAGAISSIFNKGGESSSKEGQQDLSSSSVAVKKENANIFEGDNVGNAELNSPCSDPFLTEEECRIMYADQMEVKINKHRWAHPLSHVEPGCILVANEKLGGVFHQTVVLIIDHNDKVGSTGMVINRPFPGTLMKVVSDTSSNIDLSLKMAFSKAPVSYGGPVMQDQFSTLHGYGEVEGSKKVCPGVFVGGSGQLMQEVRKYNMQPTEVLFVKGHAAWVPGQLSREIEKGVWYVAAASADLILRYAGAPVEEGDNASDLWADVLSTMGGKYEEIALANSGRGDSRMLP